MVLSDNSIRMQNAKGRIIVTGMGKSGHIGNKIAASLASTGTPSFFVHPAEASHGDLGMITEDDVVIAISNSGESKELVDIINYCKRFDVGKRDRRTSAFVSLFYPGFRFHDETCKGRGNLGLGRGMPSSFYIDIG